MVDFMDPKMVGKVLSSDPNRRNRHSAPWDKYNKDGKMVIDDSSDDDGQAEGACTPKCVDLGSL
jgi:hypothetical protein